MGGQCPRRTSHRDDGGFVGPEQLAQLLSLGPDDVAVIAFAYIPPAVGITRTGARTARRAAAIKRDDGGVEADRAVEACQLLFRAHLDRSLEEVSDNRFEA